MVFLTCLMVNICTFAGICFFACGAYKAKDVSYKVQTGLMGFACGALLSCAFFLILFSALPQFLTKQFQSIGSLNGNTR